MQPTTSFAAFLAASMALVDTATASPTVPQRESAPISGRGAFSLKQVHKPRNTGTGNWISGAMLHHEVYLKYNVSIPEELALAVSRAKSQMRSEKRATGSSKTLPPTEYDTNYPAPVEIGTPPQTLNFILDTGSSNAWVYPNTYPHNELKQEQHTYNPGASSTSSKAKGQTWEIEYGDGSVSEGDIYYDKTTIGGLTVDKFAMGTANKVSEILTNKPFFDGVLGLSFGSLNTVKPKKELTFFEAAKPLLDSYVMTVDLKAGKPGTFNFGYIDKNAYTGDIAYTPVESKDYWAFSLTGYQVGDGAFKKTKCDIVADTGTSLVFVPSDIADDYYSKVDGAGFDKDLQAHVFPCDHKLPDFTFSAGDAKITVPGSYLSIGPAEETGKTCLGGIQGEDGLPFAIIGDIALKAAFVVFDAGASRIGWAAKKLE